MYSDAVARATQTTEPEGTFPVRLFFFFFFLSEEGFPLELTWMHRGFLKSPHGSRSLAMANAEPSHTNKQKKEGKNIGRTLDVTHDTRRRLSDRAWVCFPPTCVGHVGSSGRGAG